jgi:hypothetical protein
MLYKTGLDWRRSTSKRLSLFGMSGVGKTHIANILRESKKWFHYSVDYRIGTRYLGEEIVDNFKKEAMKLPLLREHLLNDSIYLSSNITFNNLSPLSSFLGKPGKRGLGGIAFKEYIERQRKHFIAEISATEDTALFAQKALDIYGYNHFISDTSGSLCEVVNPENRNDQVLKSLQNSTLPVWIKGSDNQTEQLLERFVKSPKPMFYNERFLKEKWDEYLIEHNQNPDEVDPDEFMSYGFRALILHRLPIYAKIAKNWGVTLQATDINAIISPEHLIELVAEAIDKKNME